MVKQTKKDSSEVSQEIRDETVLDTNPFPTGPAEQAGRDRWKSSTLVRKKNLETPPDTK